MQRGNFHIIQDLHEIFMEELKNSYPGDFFERVIQDATGHLHTMNISNRNKVSPKEGDREHSICMKQIIISSQNLITTSSINQSKNFISWVMEARYLTCIHLFDKIKVKIMEDVPRKKKCEQMVRQASTNGRSIYKNQKKKRTKYG